MARFLPTDELLPSEGMTSLTHNLKQDLDIHLNESGILVVKLEKKKMKANPLTSSGARAERKAFVAYLGRLRNISPNNETLTQILEWVKARRARYDKQSGGLGKK